MTIAEPRGDEELKEEVVRAEGDDEEGEDYSDEYTVERGVSSEESESTERKVDSRSMEDSNGDGEYGHNYEDNYSHDDSNEAEYGDDSNMPRKTFYQSHIYPMHLLENLRGGGTAKTYIKEDKCMTREMCPNIVFLCGDDRYHYKTFYQTIPVMICFLGAGVVL